MISYCLEPSVQSTSNIDPLTKNSNDAPSFFTAKAAADAARKAGNIAECERVWRQVVTLCDQCGNKGEQLLEALENLTWLNLEQHRFVTAEMFCKRAVKVAIDSIGKSHPRCLALLNSLANVYYAERKFAESEPISKWLVDFYSRNNDAGHISVGIAMANLAMVFHAQGKYEQSEVCYKQALSIKLKALGSGHPEVNALLISYAKLLDATHRNVEADHFRTCSLSQRKTA